MGLSLENVEVEFLGKVGRIVIDKDNIMIVDGKGYSYDVKDRVA